jgi:hypothetical protein
MSKMSKKEGYSNINSAKQEAGNACGGVTGFYRLDE